MGYDGFEKRPIFNTLIFHQKKARRLSIWLDETD
jgi:hypothetical protein